MRRNIQSSNEDNGDDSTCPIGDDGDDGHSVAKLRDDAIVAASP